MATPDLSILGCRHPYGTPHRPWCEVVLDQADAEVEAQRSAALDPEPWHGDPLDTYDPDDRLPMAGDPYWSEDPR
jgi:hypothetical protein